jgi:hypothetical protein
MTTWLDYLSAQGLLAGSAPLPVQRLAQGFVAPLTSVGLIGANGEDAFNFLHNQITNDVLHLQPGEVKLAGYCTPKGRLQATFHYWRESDTLYLQLPRELQPALQKRLSMFILRAKAKLSDAAAEPRHEAVLGLGGAAASAALAHLVGPLPSAPWTVVHTERGTLLRVADAFGHPCYQWITDAAHAIAAWPGLSSELAAASEQAWQLAAIHAAVPTVGTRTLEQFVPQMINLELLGGVNFKKGCYPGQEVVARSQYLGKLKRRMALARVAAPAEAGEEAFSPADPAQPCGMVVNAAPNGEGGSDLLVELKLEALDQGQVHLGGAAGPALQWLPMPYALDRLDV